jgi:hypothetical protein
MSASRYHGPVSHCRDTTGSAPHPGTTGEVR